MAITIGPVTLPRSAAELLDTTDGYGAGAKIWLESSANGTSGWTAVTSEVIVAGTEAVYFRDSSGTSATYYRTYITESAGTEPSDYSAVFLTGSVAGYTDIFRAKSYLSITDAVDDARLPFVVNAVNAEMTRRIGVFLGPSSDTLRLYDGADAVRNCSRLWIPGGIRTLTAVRLASTTGGSLTAATLADFLLRPKAQELRTGMPYMRVDISDQSASRFDYGMDNVELTGTFGYAAVPDDLASLADMIVTRTWADRNAGSLASPTPSRFIYPADADMLEHYARESFPVVA